MELHFIKEKGSRTDLQVAVFEWENKMMDTESDTKRFVESGPREKSFIHATVFLRC